MLYISIKYYILLLLSFFLFMLLDNTCIHILIVLKYTQL